MERAGIGDNPSILKGDDNRDMLPENEPKNYERKCYIWAHKKRDKAGHDIFQFLPLCKSWKMVAYRLQIVTYNPQPGEPAIQ